MYGQTGAWRVPGYTEIRELGTGGAGQVVLARHDANDILVAIKYLSDELQADLHFVARFRHEARLLAAMKPNPHAARFYEYYETPQGAAIVMELIDGVSLRAMLRSEGPTGPEAALAVLKGSLLGLAAAHSIGVVHRDYKPENVMVEADGRSKLVDFGIAARAGEGVSASGTPPYMAPEQWMGAPAGPATDVYAATVVFFECLTGTRPFRAQNMAALARQHQTTPPPVEEVPPPLRGLIERGMAKNAPERPQSAEAFVQELEAVAAEAYGPAWEERGRRRLAALAGLLLPFFPLTEEAPEVGTSLAETKLGAGLLGRAGMKIGLTLVGMAVIAGGTAALVGSMSSGTTTLQAGTSVETPPASIPAVPATAAPDDTPSDDPGDTPSPKATHATATPTVRVTPRPTTGVRPPVKPTPKPTKKPTPKPTKKPTPKPTKSQPDPDPTVTAHLPGDPPSSPTPPPAPSPSPTPTTDPPSTSPTPTGRVPGVAPASSESSSADPTADPSAVPMGALAVGLVTTGLVPATLGVRRMTGRHRRRR
ncbi:serine/threonine protein kinase [Planotetraspora sp. A-T 1434]|uniref:serine/threonine-protein kinase n=1 Tax=Planotetraspora sp. A-T 1434 TaxID=2979219 RepID=UPI0021C1AFF7|nr:serine/threonine-protein kinase [Planotetraspora sp. A-T 1434]MCT9930898.1 serine/threonine protein kinase [Planotetraspora sp. A-T 1434]